MVNRLQISIRAKLSGPVGATIAGMVANSLRVTFSLLLLVIVARMFFWRYASDLFLGSIDWQQIRLRGYEVVVIGFSFLAILYFSVHFPRKWKKQKEDSKFFYFKAAGYHWKVRQCDGILLDWAVYCPECTARLIDTNGQYFCPVCRQQFDNKYYGITTLAQHVERQTTSMVQGGGQMHFEASGETL